MAAAWWTSLKPGAEVEVSGAGRRTVIVALPAGVVATNTAHDVCPAVFYRGNLLKAPEVPKAVPGRKYQKANGSHVGCFMGTEDGRLFDTWTEETFDFDPALVKA